jgi:hypothetical protein
VVEVFAAGANPALSNPILTVDIGKPAVVNGECRADISKAIASLSPGSYIATVSADGPGGAARSTASPAFSR